MSYLKKTFIHNFIYLNSFSVPIVHFSINFLFYLVLSLPQGCEKKYQYYYLDHIKFKTNLRVYVFILFSLSLQVHLFKVFKRILKFSLYRHYTFLVRFIPSYFIYIKSSYFCQDPFKGIPWIWSFLDYERKFRHVSQLCVLCCP